MTSTRVRFSVGDFQCIAIKDGTFPYPSDWSPAYWLLFAEKIPDADSIFTSFF
jgi:hypothetical protein